MSKISKAVAIKYSGGVPKVTAKGTGEVADKIIQIATEQNIERTVNQEVVDVLMDTPLMEDIPEEMYLAVAIILSGIKGIREKHENN